MKIVFLCKRRPQGRDLLTRPYGRFFYLPLLLSQRGHDVYISLLSYKREASVKIRRQGITWISESIFPAGPFGYFAKTSSLLHDVHPDWVVGFSDTYYGILAQILGGRHGINSAIDAYDNYESYLPWAKPLHACWRSAIAGATLVTAAGPHLAEHLSEFRVDRKVSVVPMAADPCFRPMDKIECRRKMGLPLDRRIIGYCGSIYRNRGINTLLEALEDLLHDQSDMMMLLTGRKDRSMRLPSYAQWLGYLPDGEVPFVFNSLDVILVVNQLSAFGKFSYPAKLYEAMSCKVPVVATSTAPINWILGGRQEFLTRPEDYADTAEKIKGLLHLSRLDYGEQSTWEHSCHILEKAMLGRA